MVALPGAPPPGRARRLLLVGRACGRLERRDTEGDPARPVVSKARAAAGAASGAAGAAGTAAGGVGFAASGAVGSAGSAIGGALGAVGNAASSAPGLGSRLGNTLGIGSLGLPSAGVGKPGSHKAHKAHRKAVLATFESQGDGEKVRVKRQCVDVLRYPSEYDLGLVDLCQILRTSGRRYMPFCMCRRAQCGTCLSMTTEVHFR